ncbi:MAG: hypothetical protein ACRD23_09840 [Terriglobales bacterium]
MSFDPEIAPPEAENISAEMQLHANQACAENREMPPTDDGVWRERGEELAPAIYDSEARPVPAQDWDEPVHPAGETGEQAPQREIAPDIRLVPNTQPTFGRDPWYQSLLGQLLENYKSLGQGAALIALGAALALLAVAFAHRRSPLPAGLQGSETIRPEVSPSKVLPKLSRQDSRRRNAVKILANPKKVSEVKSPKPTAGVKIVPGKIRLASARVVSRHRRLNFSREANFVAKDTVIRYDNHGVPLPK